MTSQLEILPDITFYSRGVGRKSEVRNIVSIVYVSVGNVQ